MKKKVVDQKTYIDHKSFDSRSGFIDSEQRFYSNYSWCLNPYPKVSQVMDIIRREAKGLEKMEGSWQINESIMTIFSLACAVSCSTDDFLNKKRYRQIPLKSLLQWRIRWEDTIASLLDSYLIEGSIDRNFCKSAALELADLSRTVLPKKMLNQAVTSPRAFRCQDLTPYDVLTLSKKYCLENTDKNKPILIIGLRSAGSYFAPVLRADLAKRGYNNISMVTLRPKKGASRNEKEKIQEFVNLDGNIVIIDEPIYVGLTLKICVKILDELKVQRQSVSVLFPLHPSATDLNKTEAPSALKGCHFITSSPDEYFKYGRLKKDEVEKQLEEYFLARDYKKATLITDTNVHKFNETLSNQSENSWTEHLKRVYGVQLERQSGEVEIQYIVAKSVGWGWQSYREFFAANCLKGFVPSILGLRDGILYYEWIENSPNSAKKIDRNKIIEIVSEYLAARVKGLSFEEDPSSFISETQVGMLLVYRNHSTTLLGRITNSLKRKAFNYRLSTLTCPNACLIDGNMRIADWLKHEFELVKTDYAQHGLGKIEVNVTDPAYDLANSVLSFELSEQEEMDLMQMYMSISGDINIAERITLYKVLTGLWSMQQSRFRLHDNKLSSRHREYSDDFIKAWTFTMIQLARYTASFVPKLEAKSPFNTIVVSDVDGVIDQHIIGIPSNTPSGIEALSLLHMNGYPIVLNTARSVYDVKEYCKAYGFLGGVAESGSYIWDAATDKEQILVSAETLTKIERVKLALEDIPGVFTNPYYKYSIKAFKYGDSITGTIPVPSELVNSVLAQCEAEDLYAHQTSTDTAILSPGIDKGTGMMALLQFLNCSTCNTIAIGDTEPDLSMFRVANHSYAPSHTNVRNAAIQIGCHVVDKPFQLGLLEIVRHIIQTNGGKTRLDEKPSFKQKEHNKILFDMLSDVEKSKPRRLLEAIFNENLFGAFKDHFL
ncbi:HAD hydrolase family protein [Confluentibacter sediminis]|uniref:HAD hydrolase family protein n=1 Tax=Confluentibacter sediminis TaxID=2219045 RepID=UPI000DACC9A3|nr:HAD hydrolase family protein [Confluentibacter sediminis]